MFAHLGLLDSNYTTMGPSEHTIFLSVVLNTWNKWGLVALYTIISSAIGDFAADSLTPFFINVVSDGKCKYIPYTKTTCILIIQASAIYGTLISCIGIHLILSQIDFVVIRLLTDLCVNVYTNSRLLRNKEYNPVKFREVEMHLINPNEGSMCGVEENCTTGTPLIPEKTNREKC